jgi:hypothetical protein
MPARAGHPGDDDGDHPPGRGDRPSEREGAETLGRGGHFPTSAVVVTDPGGMVLLASVGRSCFATCRRPTHSAGLLTTWGSPADPTNRV